MDNGIKNYYGLERNLFRFHKQGKSKWDIIRELFMERLLKKYHDPYYRDMRT